MADNIGILGGGMTGLAAGLATGFPVFEQAPTPGGICSSYYMQPGSSERLAMPPQDGEAYRFELGGGHWIFGGDPDLIKFVEQFSPVVRYKRQSSVFLPGSTLYVPYPIQYHLAFLPEAVAKRALGEMNADPPASGQTMADWMRHHFGPTLCEQFFTPFQEAYTAGTWTEIAPQDYYKTPVDLPLAKQGAIEKTPAAGYNATFIYPALGLDGLARGMAGQCDMRYGKQVVGIDPEIQSVQFADGSQWHYDALISTLPLNRVVAMSGVDVQQEADPYTSVLVLNIAGKRGSACPGDHWIYLPGSQSGFHRVGMYSNVDSSFLPDSRSAPGAYVSFYVERAYKGGAQPSQSEIADYVADVVRELQEWGYLTEVEVADPTWIEVAYTWARPGSTWRKEAMQQLEKAGIHMLGRYGRWHFQGIAASIQEGLAVANRFGVQTR